MCVMCAIHKSLLLRFSPDNRILAVGSHEGCLDFYDMSKGPSLHRVGFCKGIDGFVAMVDFTTDSRYVRVGVILCRILYLICVWHCFLFSSPRSLCEYINNSLEGCMHANISKTYNHTCRLLLFTHVNIIEDLVVTLINEHSHMIQSFIFITVKGYRQ